MVTELAASGKNELIEFDFEKIVFILNVEMYLAGLGQNWRTNQYSIGFKQLHEERARKDLFNIETKQSDSGFKKLYWKGFSYLSEQFLH